LARIDLDNMYGKNQIEIIIEDTQSDNTKAVTAAQKMLSIDKVDAFYTEFSGVSAAVSPLAEDNNKILVYSTYNQKIADDNENSIKTFISFEVACEKFAKYLNDPNKRILIISAIGDTAPYCARGLESVIDKENVKIVEGFTGKDFRTLLLQNKEFDPDFIIPIMYEDGSLALLKQNYELGLNIGMFSNKQDMATDKILSELPTEATDNIFYFEAPIDGDFEKKIRVLYPEITDDEIQAAANSYQSMIALGVGLMECKDKSAGCVTQKLTNKNDFPYSGYENMEFENRVLSSELIFGYIKDRNRIELE